MGRRARGWAILAALVALAAARPAAAEEGEPPRRRLRAFPEERAFPPYLADFHRSGFGVAQLVVADPEVEGSGRYRVGLSLGGRFGLAAWAPRDRPERPWILSIEAGFYGQFDEEHSLDNLGWDGLYAFVVTRELGAGTSIKLGTNHVSSHVGDELAERTGRRRIGYTRNEWIAAVGRDLEGGWRGYLETGWAPTVDGPFQAPWRAQGGLEHQAPGRLRGGRWGWFAALDLEAYEERDWDVSSSLMVGLLVPSHERRWRPALTWYRGRVPIGELPADEEYLLLGLWLDV